jgi:hypothetical protein
MAAPSNYRIEWQGVGDISPRDLTCAYCDREVAAHRGLKGTGINLGPSGEIASRDGSSTFFIAVCPRCGRPTFLDRDGSQVPDVEFGEVVRHLPGEIDALYGEARRSMAARNFNAAGMLGRKLLMYVAVKHGAAENLKFYKYVNYLVENHVVTPAMKPWVDEIRELGNDAAHELPHLTREGAETLMTFVAMLLRNAYEYPQAHALSVAARTAKDQPAGS